MDFSPAVYEHAARLIDETPWTVSRSPELMLKAHAEAYRLYRHSPVVLGIDIYNPEAEAYGAVVSEPSGDGIPAISQPFCSSLDEIAGLPHFNPRADGRIPMLVQTAIRLRGECPEAHVAVPVSGPFSIAANLMGLERLLPEVMSRPSMALSALEHLVDGQVALCEEIHRNNLAVSFFESAAAPPLLSPDLFREVVLPTLKDLMVRASEIIGQPVPFIMGGDTTPILDHLLETGTGYVICPAETDQKAFMERVWDRTDVTVRVNMSPLIVSRGTRDEIREEVDRIVTLTEGRKNVCLGTGPLPYETPPENVLWIKEYV